MNRRKFLKRSAYLGLAASYPVGMELGRRRGEEEQIERDMARRAEKATQYITGKPEVEVDSSLLTGNSAKIILDANIRGTYEEMSEQETAELEEGIAAVMDETASYAVNPYNSGTIDYTFVDQLDDSAIYRLDIGDAAEIYADAVEDESVGDELFAVSDNLDGW